MRAWLLRGFDYDLWANRQWLPALFSEECNRVYDHMLGAQRVWLTRCLGEEEVREAVADRAQQTEQLAEDWRDLLNTCDPTAYISYTNMRGESFFQMVEDIAAHVINHGTYHRGQLRQLAEDAGREFPETDLILYLRTH